MAALSQKALRAEVLRRRGLVNLPEAARAVGLSVSSLYRACKVVQVCDPDLEALMDSRELSIEQAARLAALPEVERRSVLALPARARKEAVRRLLKNEAREAPAATGGGAVARSGNTAANRALGGAACRRPAGPRARSSLSAAGARAGHTATLSRSAEGSRARAARRRRRDRTGGLAAASGVRMRNDKVDRKPME